MDLLKADQEISPLKLALEDMRANIDDQHHSLYEEAVQFAVKVGFEPNRPRTVQREIHRSNLPIIFCGRVLPSKSYCCFSGLLVTTISVKISF